MSKKSSKKRLKQSKNRKKINLHNKSKLKTFLKKIYKNIKNKEKEKSINLYPIIQSIIDKSEKKKIIHKNKASRYKSKIIKKINLLKKI